METDSGLHHVCEIDFQPPRAGPMVLLGSCRLCARAVVRLEVTEEDLKLLLRLAPGSTLVILILATLPIEPPWLVGAPDLGLIQGQARNARPGDQKLWSSPVGEKVLAACELMESE